MGPGGCVTATRGARRSFRSNLTTPFGPSASERAIGAPPAPDALFAGARAPRPLVRFQDFLANSDGLGRHLDILILGNKFQSLFERDGLGGNQANGFIGG